MVAMPRTRKDRVDWPALTEGISDEWFPVAVFDIGMLTDRNWKARFDYEPLAELVPRKRPAIISASVMVLDFSVGDVMGEDITVCPPWFDDALKEQAADHFGVSVDEYLARSRSTDEALGVLAEHFDVARVIASHNLGTDLKQIRLDAMRIGRDFYAHEDKHLFCTMLNGAEVSRRSQDIRPLTSTRLGDYFETRTRKSPLPYLPVPHYAGWFLPCRRR
jgi:hypothetical protein